MSKPPESIEVGQCNHANTAMFNGSDALAGRAQFEPHNRVTCNANMWKPGSLDTRSCAFIGRAACLCNQTLEQDE